MVISSVVNIGDGLDQYCVKLIVLVQTKQSDIAIDWHKGKISGEVIVDNTADFIHKGTKTNTRPIKATRAALDLIKAQQKATENSKTGKVTAVVAVVKIFGNKIVNSRISRSGKTEIKPVLSGNRALHGCTH